MADIYRELHGLTGYEKTDQTLSELFMSGEEFFIDGYSFAKDTKPGESRIIKPTGIVGGNVESGDINNARIFIADTDMNIYGIVNPDDNRIHFMSRGVYPIHSIARFRGIDMLHYDGSIEDALEDLQGFDFTSDIAAAEWEMKVMVYKDRINVIRKAIEGSDPQNEQ